MSLKPQASTLVELMRWRGQETPDQLAYVFLRDGQKDELPLTYGELDAKARLIAARLLSSMEPGSRVLINHLPGLDYISSFFGCLYASMVAVPVYPPRFNQKLDRLNSIVGSARPAAALTSRQILESLRPSLVTSALLAPLDWIETDALSEADPGGQLPAPSAETLAFLQYTSGSTSEPKGVMLSHGNLMANLDCIRTSFGLSTESRAVIWLPPYHDMGLIGGLLEPAYVGFPLVFFSPFAFLQRPYRWLQAVSKYRATCTGGPNFAYDLCARRVTDEQLAELDLSSLEVAFCGAEPIRAEMIERFSSRFARAHFRREAFYPCYGLAEATLIVSGGEKGTAPILNTIDGDTLENQGIAIPAGHGAKHNVRSLVGCGHEVAGHKVRVVNPETGLPCAEGQVGEIWFSGPSVAQGYWERPEETQIHFQATLPDDPDGERYLRTGDLGFLNQGELFVTGRLKDLLIINGRNLYPQDIELTVENSHPSLKAGAGAAFALMDPEDEKLIIVQELERKSRDIEVDPIFEAICTAVMESHGVRPHAVSLIESNSIPLTSSGKIQRHAARRLFLSGELRERGRFTEK